LYSCASSRKTARSLRGGRQVLAEDAHNTLWTSTGVVGPGVVGWLDRKMFEETGDEQKSQGWTPFILDTNGNGKRDEYVEPGQPVGASKDTRVALSLYAVSVSPLDGSVWGTSLGYPGAVVRVDPGADPTHTALRKSMSRRSPAMDRAAGTLTATAFSAHRLRAGISRASTAASASCSMGRAATGKHCPEGWTLYAGGVSPFDIRPRGYSLACLDAAPAGAGERSLSARAWENLI
jgi:hypothetical protein